MIRHTPGIYRGRGGGHHPGASNSVTAGIQASKQEIDRGTWLALIAMGIAVFVIANDFSAINVAIPQIEQDLDTNVTTTQWVVNAYALTFGVLIVTGGRLADLFGRRNAFFVGSAVFASMSLAGGAAQSEAWLIAARVLMARPGRIPDRAAARRPPARAARPPPRRCGTQPARARPLVHPSASTPMNRRLQAFA